MGKISLVLPVYNEGVILQEVLAKYVSDLKNLKTPYEVIVVNDGSNDATNDILLQYAKLNRYLRVVTLDGRYGKQAAITAGMDASDPDSDMVILADIDILNPVGIIKKLVEEFHEKNCAILYARREHDGRMKAKRRFADRMVGVGIKIFGLQGKYTGKTNIALYSRAAADVIIALPNRNAFLRTMDNWVGWDITYTTYAKAYTEHEHRRKMHESKTRHREQFAKTHNVKRDNIREHSASVDVAWGMLFAGIILIIAAIIIAVLSVGQAWVYILFWLGAVALFCIAYMFWVHSILVKHIGLMHTTMTKQIYVVKDVIN